MNFDVNKQRFLFKALIVTMIVAILPWTQGWFAAMLSYSIVPGISVLAIVALGTIPLLVQFHRREL